MPEEINRVVTDQLADLLFATESSALEHLQTEGIDAAKVHLVGNTMIDTLHTHLQLALDRQPWQAYGVEPGGYALVTFHRPGNVDHRETVAGLRAPWPKLLPMFR